jgi:hypothetical protein
MQIFREILLVHSLEFVNMKPRFLYKYVHMYKHPKKKESKKEQLHLKQ